MKHTYLVVAEDIVSRIRAGEWGHGERVPSVRSLEQLYPHSRMTLHKALRHLVKSGYLRTERGRGSFVRSTHVRDSVGILAGGLLGGHARTPIADACIDHACAYFKRCGLEARLYSDDPLSATSLPVALEEDLESGKLKGLLTVLSRFPYRYMRTDQWRRRPLPHVDIGNVTAPHRVYIDFDAFVGRAI